VPNLKIELSQVRTDWFPQFWKNLQKQAKERVIRLPIRDSFQKQFCQDTKLKERSVCRQSHTEGPDELSLVNPNQFLILPFIARELNPVKGLQPA
jgi:hypothetical protein